MGGHKASSTAPIDLRAILPLPSSSSGPTTGEVAVSGEGQQGSLGFGALLHALAAAGAVKAQVDAMDILKERLKKCSASNATPAAAAAGAEVERGYLLMLRLYLDPRAVALRKAAHRIMAQLVALAGEEGAALEARAAARFLQEWIEEHGVTDDSSSKTKAPEEEQEVEDRAHGIVALHTIEEAAAFPPTRRALCGGATARPNAHMVALAGYVLRAITRSSAGPVPHAETALVALKALTALLTAWRLESSAPCSSLVAALHQRQAGVVPALVEASAALLRSAALPYEVKNQAGLVLVLAALDSADGNDDDAGLAQALAACFLSSSGGSAGLLAQLHPSLRGLPAALAPILHTSTSTSTSVASEAGLALARAVLVATDQGVLTAALPPALPLQYDASVAAGGTLMGGPILALLLAECQSPLPPSRLLAFTALEAWLGRALDFCRRSSSATDIVGALALPTVLPAAANLLLWNWETSNKKVATVVPQAFERLVQLLQALEEQQEQQAQGSTMASGGGALPLSVSGLATMLGQQAPTRRSRYAGLKALLPILGPTKLLALCPNLIPSLLAAITAGGNVAPPASRLLMLVLRLRMPTSAVVAGARQGKKKGEVAATAASEQQAQQEQAVVAVRALWLRPVAQALCHPHRPARTRIADYLLQELVALDPPAALHLMGHIRSLSSSPSTSTLGDTHLWALLSVAEVARGLGGLDPALAQSLQLLPASSTQGGTGSTAMVTLEEARRAGLCGDCDVRYAAIRVAVASPKTTTLPTAGERALVDEVLSLSLKAPLSGQRHGLARAFRPLFTRYHETLRIHSGGSKSGKLGVEGGSANGAGGELEAAEQAVATVARILCESLYPGTNVSRDAAALELLALLLAGCPAPHAQTLACPSYRRALAPLLASAAAVHSLLNLFLAPWERTRRQAFDLLGAFPPGPLPGLCAADGSVAPSAMHWALRLTLSARRGEAEAGALMLRLLFQRAYLLPAPSSGGATSRSVVSLLCDDEQPPEDGRVGFLRGLRRLIERRLDGFERGMEAWGAGEGQGDGIVMVFGAIQAARFVLEEAAAAEAGDAADAAVWGREVELLLALMERAMEVALRVIGTQEEGLPESLLFEKNEADAGGQDDDEEYRAEAPLNTAEPGFVVDCRGHLIRSGGAGDGEEGGEEEENGAGGEGHHDDTRKRLIVGGWMMAKEAGACLAEIVRQAAAATAPRAAGAGAKKGQRWSGGGRGEQEVGQQQPQQNEPAVSLLDSVGGVGRVDAVGRTLLRSLGRMKHMGGIQCTQAALMAVTRALLLAGPTLAALPQQWMDGLLDRLRNPRQHFVLRRSAGLASGFLAIVGAEPSNAPPALLPQLMGELLRLAQASNPDWRTRIHALNVLRLLLLDAGPSREASRAHMAPAMAVVLQGFRDPRWAVRNSALMVFGALVNAAVGSGKNALGSSAGGEGGPRAQPSAHDFLRRHPDFLLIVAAELQRCLRSSSSSSSSSATANADATDATDALAQALACMGLEGGGDDTVAAATAGPNSTDDEDAAAAADASSPPSLFPLILLLSRLRPPTESLAEDEQGSALDHALKGCLPYVARCACLPDGLMRLTAARAFASLVGTARAPGMVVALVSALPSSSSAATAAAAPNSNATHGILLMANALLRGLLGVARTTAAAPSGDNEAEGAAADEEAAAQVTALLAPLHDPAFLRALTEDKGPALLVPDARRRGCPPVVRQEALQLLLACHQLVTLSPSPSPSSAAPPLAPLLPLLRAATQRVLTEQGLFDASSSEDEHSVRLPPVPGLAALVAWAARWHALFSLGDGADAASAAAAARLLARGLGQQGLLEVRRESLRVLLLLLGRTAGAAEEKVAAVDLGEGSTEDEKDGERRMMAWQADRLATGGAAGWAVAAATALVAQVQREGNPNLLKGQLAALCLLLGSSSSSGVAAGKGLWAFVARLARVEGDAADEEDDTGEIAARALELLGHLLASQCSKGVARRWLRRVELAAWPEGRPSLRMAALRSVAASGLLRQRGDASTNAAVAVGGLFAVLRLAHDDDDDVRGAACTLLAASLVDPSGTSRPATPYLDHQANAALARMAAADAGAAQAWVQGVVSILRTRAASLPTTLASHLPSPSPLGGLGLPEQIFRPEPDNVFEEPAVVAYWACRSLLAALAAAPAERAGDSWWLGEEAAPSAVVAELRALLAPLLEGASSSLLRRALEGSAWVGGLTNHPEVLPGLFAALLAALLLAVLSEEDGKELGSQIVAAAAAAAAAAQKGGDKEAHVLIRWAIDSVEAVVTVVGGSMVGLDVGARARKAVACVDWNVVDGYGPFGRPALA